MYHEVLQKYGNSKYSNKFTQILFITTDDSSSDVLGIVFQELNFREVKINDGIKVF